MATTNTAPFDSANPLWEVTASRNGHSVVLTISISDPDSEATTAERDQSAGALADALTSVGFEFVQTRRIEVTYTSV